MDNGTTNHISKTLPTPNGSHTMHTFFELPNGGKINVRTLNKHTHTHTHTNHKRTSLIEHTIKLLNERVSL